MLEVEACIVCIGGRDDAGTAATSVALLLFRMGEGSRLAPVAKYGRVGQHHDNCCWATY